MTADTPETPGAPAPYGTPDAPRVAVRGEAHLEVDPEIARIGIAVSTRSADRRTAVADLTRRNNDVIALIKAYGDAVEKLETGTYSISPELTKRGRGERIHAYHGRVHITAELTDFTVLGELTTRLADLDLTHITGPWWGLRPNSPARAEARRQAVREAVQRAREYAGALGAELAALVELADIGAENAGGYGAPAPAGSLRNRAAYGGAADPEQTPALDLEPQRQTLHAHVNARFTMTPPDLGA
jgi:uncharacterized protein YggE